MHGVMRNACKILAGKPEGMRLLGTPRRELGIRFKPIPQKSRGRCEFNSRGLRQGQTADLREHGREFLA